MKNIYVSPDVEILSLAVLRTDVISESGREDYDLPEIPVW